jgi:hypothetical protein
MVMDRKTVLLIMQGAGITGQLINAQAAVITGSARMALLMSAVLAGYQFVIQHLGNMTPVNEAANGKTEGKG